LAIIETDRGIQIYFNSDSKKHIASIRFNCEFASNVKILSFWQFEKHNCPKTETERGIHIDFIDESAKHFISNRFNRELLSKFTNSSDVHP
jgi:hypothetical protein